MTTTTPFQVIIAPDPMFDGRKSMRIRSTAAAIVLAAAATLPMAGLALAQPGDQDCNDFADQQEAQAHFDAQTGDPDRLDEDDDGQACENHEYGTGTGDGSDDSGQDDDNQVTTVPRGGVDTGDGSAAGGGEMPAVVLLGGLVVLGAGAVATRRAGSRSS